MFSMLLGNKLYKKAKKSMDYLTIQDIKKQCKEEYMKLDDVNEVLQLIEKTEKSIFEKEIMAAGLQLGLLGSLVFCIIEKLVLEPISNARDEKFISIIILSVISTLLSLIVVLFVIWVLSKIIKKQHKNAYTIFILPYELELLKTRLNQLTNNEWNSTEIKVHKRKVSVKCRRHLNRK